MNRLTLATVAVSFALIVAGCGAKPKQTPKAAGAATRLLVEPDQDVNIVKVDHPEQFPVA